MNIITALRAASLACAAIALAPACALAQALTVDHGFEQHTILSLPVGTGGFDFDSAGNILYIGSSEINSADTQVVQATKASHYNTLNLIADYGSSTNPVSTYGAFVTVDGNKVYYGDSVAGPRGDGDIEVNYDRIINPTPAPIPVVNMPDDFDLVFSGTAAFVSADIRGAASFAADNSVYSLNLSTHKYKDILDTGDYSGPIEITASGELIYGESGYGSGGGIYIFSAASVDKAISTGTPMTLSDAAKVIADKGNGAFALGPDNELFSAFTPDKATDSVTEYNLLTGDATPICSLANEGDYFSGMQYFDGELTLAETDDSSFTDFIDVAAIPEPAATPLAISALILIAALGRNRLHLGLSA